MVTKGGITIYHKQLNTQTRLEEYARYYYSDCWQFGGKGSSINKGYAEANDINIRIPYSTNQNADIGNFTIGDIIFIGEGPNSIEKQSDLKGEAYNVTSITNNNFGNNQHIHIGGK